MRAPGAMTRIKPSSLVKIVTMRSDSPKTWVFRLIPVTL
ncbi:hypothetical protein RintRC_1148 [Richelia intracellularis]|nr:hypothetical protein RintRC_1148 [Richelia intracellularis]